MTTVVDGTEYGGEGAGKPNNVPVTALSDLYKVGLGFKTLVDDEDIEGLDYGRLETWGSDIHETYEEDTSEPDSEYLSVQGHLMEQGAREEITRRSLEGEDTEVYIE